MKSRTKPESVMTIRPLVEEVVDRGRPCSIVFSSSSKSINCNPAMRYSPSLALLLDRPFFSFSAGKAAIISHKHLPSSRPSVGVLPRSLAGLLSRPVGLLAIAGQSRSVSPTYLRRERYRYRKAKRESERAKKKSYCAASQQPVGLMGSKRNGQLARPNLSAARKRGLG